MKINDIKAMRLHMIEQNEKPTVIKRVGVFMAEASYHFPEGWFYRPEDSKFITPDGNLVDFDEIEFQDVGSH